MVQQAEDNDWSFTLYDESLEITNATNQQVPSSKSSIDSEDHNDPELETSKVDTTKSFTTNVNNESGLFNPFIIAKMNYFKRKSNKSPISKPIYKQRQIVSKQHVMQTISKSVNCWENLLEWTRRRGYPSEIVSQGAKSILEQAVDTHHSITSEFEKVLPDLFIVYENADKNLNVLGSEVLPVNFHEENPYEIVYTLKKRLDDKSETTSVQKKFANNEYSTPYQVYHDLKAASSALIQKHQPGSEEYRELDFFYKFTTEVLLREVGNLITSNSGGIKTELENQLDEDFDKIITTYSLTNGEIITYISKTEEPEPTGYANLYSQHNPVVKQRIQPLFSSIIEKSELDPQQTIVPDPFSVTKVVPSIKDVGKSDSVLDNLTPVSTKIPTPLESQTSMILYDFFHPTWYTITVPTWINYRAQVIKPANMLPQQASQLQNQKLKVLQQRDDKNSTILSEHPSLVWAPGNNFRSFAPSQDSKDSIINSELKGRVWLNHLGIAEIEKIRMQYLEDKDENDEDEVEDEEPREESEQQEEETKVELTNNENEPMDVDSTSTDSEVPINVANLIQWNPAKIKEFKLLKDSKSDIINPVKLQKLISVSLLKLNKLRQDRYLRSDIRNPLAPEPAEYKLYARIQKYITLAIQLYKISPSSFSYEFSKRIPVLVSEYSGTLPGVAPNRISAGNAAIAKPSRLPSIRGPYKKTKGRY
ncbi:Chromatin structure-remodeling complex protein RSC58 [Spathaspora sp. JA1]|nr:Chromatin structure-remodeling complex protein RSC58 [Spathaspora sp. JA1]